MTLRWAEDALCRQIGPALWFADPRSPDASLAAKLCLHCPVIVECRAFADQNGEEYGVWGGVQRHPVAYYQKSKQLARDRSARKANK